MINDFGGGMLPGHEFGFALVGGAAGKFAPPELFELTLDFSSGDQGAHLGVGVALICDTNTSPVAVLRELLHFFEVESCGKCTPCRIGTRQSRKILDRILAGEASHDAVEELLQLADIMGAASFCGLGISVPWPVKSAIKHFRHWFERPDSSLK
jgi:NADH:ubiquinone oxidoreductase subunit F (NADH-binding)